MITITSKVEGYRRCGRLHPARATEYPDDYFTKEELAVMAADPILEVVVTAPEELNQETLSKKTVEVLRAMAAGRSIELPARANKQEIIDLLLQPVGGDS